MLEPTRQDEVDQLDRVRWAADRMVKAQEELREATALLHEAAAHEIRFRRHSRLGGTARKLSRLMWEIGNRLPGLLGTAEGLADKLDDEEDDGSGG